MIYETESTNDQNIQQANIYNKYTPICDSIKKQAPNMFDEIKSHLSRLIQFGEIECGFSFWSNKLADFITLYGFYFTKTDHIKLVNYYIFILTIDNLNYTHVRTCFNQLRLLLRFV